MLQLLEEPALDALDAFAPDGDLAGPPDTAAAAEPGFTKASVAELSPRRIAAMSTGDLARAIRSVSVLRFCDDRRLDFLDRPTLERLVYLARQCCRNQGY